MFWGDRYAKLTDPFGHMWGIATHIEDVAPQEMEKRAKEAMTKQQAAAQAG
jgi:PhnB protein